MKLRLAALLGLFACLAALGGCRNRAYNDLYIQNMAAEIRGLEDQLYEYDEEYRALERELAAAKAKNASLESGRSPTRSNRNALPSGDSPSSQSQLPFLPRGDNPPVPNPPKNPEAIVPGSILESSEDKLPNGSNAASPFPARPSTSNSPATGDFNSDSFDIQGLEPPTIEPGEPTPPPLPVLLEGLNASQGAPDNSFEMNLSRIDVPAQLAGTSSGAQASITLATEKVTDRRVVELAFHPTLSRAASFDDRSDDDGLYLVLQPKNQRGQMVPEAAALTVVILDPAREGDATRIGRWDYTAEEVKGKMRPIGANQGIHLTLPWNGPDPSADRVIVFAKYTFENGRQVIGQKEIFVSSDGGLKTVWAPRGRSTASGTGSVVQASAQQPERSIPTSSVVRPASGTTLPEGAPAPRRSGNW